MGALEGMKVLDFTTLLPGPYATMTLADMGADVLKIAAPNRVDMAIIRPPKVPGEEVNGLAATLYRNKKTMFLDLKSEEGIKIVKELIQEYDIIVEQFRPGVMDRMGLGYETLSKINPKLIYCSLTGYGQTGPLKMHAGHDINYLARSGIISYAGRKGQLPSSFGTQLADLMGGLNVVIGVLTAYIARQTSGKGQYIDVAMLDGVVNLTLGTAGDTLIAGIVHQPEDQQTTGMGFYDYYETSDGRYMSVGSMEPKFWKNFCEAIGMPELIEGTCYPKNIDELKPKVREVFKGKTQAEWIEVFSKTDACVEPVLNYDEMVVDEQINARDMIVDVPFDDGVVNRQMASPIKFSGTPYEYKFAGRPIGYDTQDVLEKLGYSADERAALKEKGVIA
jgi:alpha-methylacyl-CoA racemase